MKITPAKDLINKHNEGLIHISTIISDNRILLDNIEKNSKLDYSQERHTLTYINSEGLINTLTNVDLIDQILYKKINSDENDEPTINCDCDCGCEGNCSICTNLDCPQKEEENDDFYEDETENDPNKDFPESPIVKQGYIKNGIIYPTQLEDGTLIYDCALGTIKPYTCGKEDGVIKRNKEIFSSYFGDGYALLMYGLIEMNIYIPETAYFSFNVRAGSESSSGKRGSIFLNGVERFIITSADKQGIWELKEPLKYCEECDNFLEIESIKFLSGINKIFIKIDTLKGTTNNAYDCIVMKKNKRDINQDCNEYFHISEEEYRNIVEQIKYLNNYNSLILENLKKTFITVETLEDLNNLLENKEILSNGKIVKVNNVNGESLYYYWNSEKQEFIEGAFDEAILSEINLKHNEDPNSHPDIRKLFEWNDIE